MLPGLRLRVFFCVYLGRRVRPCAHGGSCLHKLTEALTFFILRLSEGEPQNEPGPENANGRADV